MTPPAWLDPRLGSRLRTLGRVLFVLLVIVLCLSAARRLVQRFDRELALESCERLEARSCLRLCDEGHVPSCFQLGRVYAEGRDGVAPDRERALALFERACAGWDRRGCRELGLVYRAGVWRPRDLERALALLKLACEGQEGQACTALAEMYEEGWGVAADVQRATLLYQQGCAGFDAEGCARAGTILARGAGVERDVARALPLLEQGCRRGIALACRTLAEGHESGWASGGAGRDETRAARYRRRACDRGDTDSCGWLATHATEKRPGS